MCVRAYIYTGRYIQITLTIAPGLSWISEWPYIYIYIIYLSGAITKCFVWLAGTTLRTLCFTPRRSTPSTTCTFQWRCRYRVDTHVLLTHIPGPDLWWCHFCSYSGVPLHRELYFKKHEIRCGFSIFHNRRYGLSVYKGSSCLPFLLFSFRTLLQLLTAATLLCVCIIHWPWWLFWRSKSCGAVKLRLKPMKVGRARVYTTFAIIITIWSDHSCFRFLI